MNKQTPCDDTKRNRVDQNGRAFAGSQRQIQTYVNSCPDTLNEAIAQSFGDDFPAECSIHWVSPLAAEQYREYRDGDVLRLLGFPQHIDALNRFWPKGGPWWDALARIEDANGHPSGCILVEAKSHAPECYQADTGATGKSLELIQNSLNRTKEWLGIPQQVPWTGFANPEECLYQCTNRLAHLYFLREIVRVPAFLVNVHFVGDRHSPTEQAVWQTAISEIHEELGLHRLPSCFANVFLPATQ